MYKDKKGLYRESVMIDGKRKVFSAKRKQDLMLKIAKYNNDRRIELIEALKFRSVAEEWKEAHWCELRIGSKRSYAPCYERALEKFGDRDIDSIRPIEIQAWLRELGYQYALKTVQNHKGVMSQIFDFAILNLNMEISNPCNVAKLPSGLRKGTRDSLKQREVDAVLSTTKDELQLAYLIMFTGCRCGEALALQYKDVDFNQSVIHITKGVVHVGNRPVLQAPKTKNSVRDVPLLPQLRDRLLELNLKADDYIVSGEYPLTKSALCKRWNKYCKSKDISIDRHSIRHQYATMLYEAGIDPKSAQELLGHAQISTTMDIYTHLTDSKKAENYLILATFCNEQIG